MKRRMHKNSLSAYEKLKSSYKLSEGRAKVISAIAKNGGKATILQIAELTGKMVHQISGRITELHSPKYDYQLIEDFGDEVINGNNYTVWKLKDEVFEDFKDLEAAA